MSSRNPTVSSSTTFSKKIKKSLPPIIPPETIMLISEVPDFLRRLNIMRVPTKPAEQALPYSKTETEEIIAAMKETLMASPAPTPVILPKKRKRPIYDFKQLAEKIAKHDHNEILDPKVEEVIVNTEDTVPIPVVKKNKGKKLMNEIDFGLIKQNRLRRKRENPSKVPEKVVPPKKAKIEIQEKKSKTAVELIPVKKSKSRIQSQKITKVADKIIDENFASKIQTRNRKKNFIEKSISNEKLIKEDRPINNNDLSCSFVDLESSQEISSSEVPQKKTVKVNPFKPKARNRRKPGVFFGSRKRKRNLKTENKIQPSKVDNAPLSKIVLKSELINSNALVLEPTHELQVLQNCDETLEDITKTEDTISQESLQHIQNEPMIATVTVNENVVTAPISADTTESLEPEEAAEPLYPIQSDAFYDLPSISLGSILSSVNQAS